MKNTAGTARRRALIAAAAAFVVLGGSACTTTERSTGTSTNAASSASPEAFSGSAQSSAAGTGAAEAPRTDSTGAKDTVPRADSSSAASAPPASSGSAGAAPTEASASATATTKGSAGAGEGDATTTAFADQPAVVAAAKASVDQVVQLHALAVSAGHPDRIPGEVIPSTASTIADTLDQQVTMVLAMAPAADSAQAKLADALDGYSDLAGQLATWDPASGKPMSAKFFAALAKNDKAYLAALKKLGAVTGENLVEGMPELLMPTT